MGKNYIWGRHPSQICQCLGYVIQRILEDQDNALICIILLATSYTDTTEVIKVILVIHNIMFSELEAILSRRPSYQDVVLRSLAVSTTDLNSKQCY